MKNNCLFVLKKIALLVLIALSFGISGCATIEPQPLQRQYAV